MSLYTFENLSKNENIQNLLKFLATEAHKIELHKVEDRMYKLFLAIGKDLLNEFLHNKGTGKKDFVKVSGDEIIPFHSIKSRKYLSIFGHISIKRAYFWKHGIRGIFPLDMELNLPVRIHSYLLDKWLQKGISQGPYEEAIDSINDILYLKTTKQVSQKISVEASQDIENYYKQKSDFPEEGSHIIIQADCKGIVMVPRERPETKLTDAFTRRAKGVSKIGTKKDSVVTADYSINPTKRTPKDVLEGLMQINSNKKNENKSPNRKKKESPINKQVFATMQGKEKAFEMLLDRVKSRDPNEAKPIFILIDGAVSLEKGLLKELNKRNWQSRLSGCCLDIVHATEYLWDASTALHGEASPERVLWVRSALSLLLNNKVGSVIKDLENKINLTKLTKFKIKRLKRTITYFKNHKHMMEYKKYLNEGYPIASGAIEGACNTLVKDRTERSGMLWTKKGAGAVISLRSVQCNEDWDKYWNYYVQNSAKRLYGHMAA
jgi:hypothetical protein